MVCPRTALVACRQEAPPFFMETILNWNMPDSCSVRMVVTVTVRWRGGGGLTAQQGCGITSELSYYIKHEQYLGASSSSMPVIWLLVLTRLPLSVRRSLGGGVGCGPVGPKPRPGVGKHSGVLSCFSAVCFRSREAHSMFRSPCTQTTVWTRRRHSAYSVLFN